MKAREPSAAEFYSQVDATEVTRLFQPKSRMALWKKVAEGKIPAPRYPEPHKPRWRLGELVEMLEKQPKMRDAPRGPSGQGEADTPTPPVSRGKSQKCGSTWGSRGPDGTRFRRHAAVRSHSLDG